MIRELDYERSTSVPTTALATYRLVAPMSTPVKDAGYIVSGVLIAFGCFWLGWIYRGLFSLVYDYRGFAALLIFAVVLAAVTIRGRNAR